MCHSLKYGFSETCHDAWHRAGEGRVVALWQSRWSKAQEHMLSARKRNDLKTRSARKADAPRTRSKNVRKTQSARKNRQPAITPCRPSKRLRDKNQPQRTRKETIRPRDGSSLHELLEAAGIT